MKPKLTISHDWPGDLRRNLERAIAAFENGDATTARRLFEEVLEQEKNVPEAHLGLSFLLRPGPGYLDWLACLHDALKPRIYLEIGVEAGASLRLARKGARAIGIDPKPAIAPGTVFAASTHIEAATSDAYFGSDAGSVGAGGIDFAFIDGDHRFEQCLRDFIALEARMAPAGVIAIHDTWPLTSGTASPVRKTGFYTGDCWKIVPCLRALRPELQVMTLKTAPSGLTLVRGLQPRSRHLSDRYEMILDVYGTLDYQHSLDSCLALYPNEQTSMAGFLGR